MINTIRKILEQDLVFTKDEYIFQKDSVKSLFGCIVLTTMLDKDLITIDKLMYNLMKESVKYSRYNYLSVVISYLLKSNSIEVHSKEKNKIVFRIIDNTILKSLYDIKKESSNIIKELDKFESNSLFSNLFESNDCNMNDFTNRINEIKRTIDEQNIR